MKGQIFILGAVALAIAMFALLPMLQNELYLPKADSPALENIATEYNYWISGVSISDKYDPLAFGRFVKMEYPYVEFFYVLTDKDKVYPSNFFDNSFNASINGRGFLIEPNSSIDMTFHGNITFQSEYRNFSYEPKNDFSGAIFLRIKNSQVELREYRVFR
jgi:hypothetical protein